MPRQVISLKCLKGQWVKARADLPYGDNLGSRPIHRGTFGMIREFLLVDGKYEAIIGFWWGSPPLAPHQLETVNREFFDKYEFTDPPPDYEPNLPKPPP